MATLKKVIIVKPKIKGNPGFFMRGCRFIMLILFSLSLAAPHQGGAAADLYRYRDQDGNWAFTNDPSVIPKMPDNERGAGPETTSERDTARALRIEKPARNEIERARNATVVIRSSRGFGSGFFVTDDGYILTNKHVVKSDRKDQERVEGLENALKERGRRLEEERGRLLQAEKRLKMRKNRISDAHYAVDKRELVAWHRDFNERKEAFGRKLNEFRVYRQNILYPSNFRIFLVDETEYPVTVVATSWKYDLALLRLQGYRTPYIERGDADRLVHGDPLYAIGSPVKLSLKHTVTSGIFSGRRTFDNKRFIQTNAQISPGNSGGPLLNKAGQVIGINTWKIVGDRVEGLGFAIPIHIATEEFKGYLGG